MKKEEMSESHLILCHRLLKNLPITKKKKKKEKENPLLMDKKDGKGEKMTNFPKRTFWYVDKRNVENLLNVVEDEEGFYSKAFFSDWRNGGIGPKKIRSNSTFLSSRFYVKPILENLKVPVLPLWISLILVNFSLQRAKIHINDNSEPLNVSR